MAVIKSSNIYVVIFPSVLLGSFHAACEMSEQKIEDGVNSRRKNEQQNDDTNNFEHAYQLNFPKSINASQILKK